MKATAGSRRPPGTPGTLTERAGRASAPCVLVSPAPTLRSAELGPVKAPSRSAERAGWAVLEVIDRRREPPASGLYSERLVRLPRRRTPCACSTGPGESAARLRHVWGDRSPSGATPPSARTARALSSAAGAAPRGRSSARRAVPDASRRRTGVTARRTWRPWSASRSPRSGRGPSEIHRAGGRGHGSRAAPGAVGRGGRLPRLRPGDTRPWYRVEQALVLLARASRVVGGRRGRVAVQTRSPDHAVIAAALRRPGPAG